MELGRLDSRDVKSYLTAWAPHPLSFLVCKIWIEVRLVDDKTTNKGPSTVPVGGGELSGSALFV